MEDLTNKRFGKLVATEIAYVKNYRRYWKCKCDCKNITVVREDALIRSTRSCGCLINADRKGEPITHGLNGSRIQRIYNGMKQRCYNKNNHGYGDYGGRGIKICDEWLGENGLLNFYNWAMANGYEDDLSIDRIENDGNYEPSNCRWSNDSEQRRNQRQKQYEVDGEIHTIKEWAEISNIKYDTLRWRINNGWDIKDAISQPESHISREKRV